MGSGWAKKDYCTLSPDRLFDVDLSECCFLHDLQYISHKVSRKQSDVLLKMCIETKYAKIGKMRLGWLISRIYYLFVRTFGWIFW